MKTLYFECTSGISGDMTAAALLDLGADEKKLRKALESLHLDGWHLHISRTSKCGIDACDFDVHLEDDPHAAAHTIHSMTMLTVTITTMTTTTTTIMTTTTTMTMTTVTITTTTTITTMTIITPTPTAIWRTALPSSGAAT